MTKKLYKSNTNKVICGVCGGIAEYFNWDPTIVRIIWALFTLAGGSGIVLYIICAVVMPNAPYTTAPQDDADYADYSNHSN
ncbi:MAG: PspC domain-containing protein [Defluviitaleaceae bacterium]|nr:PspC domain-containing protein [Defluviitaleaceae bacterium]